MRNVSPYIDIQQPDIERLAHILARRHLDKFRTTAKSTMAYYAYTAYRIRIGLLYGVSNTPYNNEKNVAMDYHTMYLELFEDYSHRIPRQSIINGLLVIGNTITSEIMSDLINATKKELDSAMTSHYITHMASLFISPKQLNLANNVSWDALWSYAITTTTISTTKAQDEKWNKLRWEKLLSVAHTLTGMTSSTLEEIKEESATFADFYVRVEDHAGCIRQDDRKREKEAILESIKNKCNMKRKELTHLESRLNTSSSEYEVSVSMDKIPTLEHEIFTLKREISTLQHEIDYLDFDIDTKHAVTEKMVKEIISHVGSMTLIPNTIDSLVGPIEHRTEAQEVTTFR